MPEWSLINRLTDIVGQINIAKIEIFDCLTARFEGGLFGGEFLRRARRVPRHRIFGIGPAAEPVIGT